MTKLTIQRPWLKFFMVRFKVSRIFIKFYAQSNKVLRKHQLNVSTVKGDNKTKYSDRRYQQTNKVTY
jgi:hypothetical protein